MSIAQQALMELDSTHEFFNRSTRNLTEAHSTFAPAEGMMTVAQQVAHVAQRIDWFVEGAFRPEGFDQNWEEQAKTLASYTSLEKARAWFERTRSVESAARDDRCPRRVLRRDLEPHLAHVRERRGPIILCGNNKGQKTSLFIDRGKK